MMPFGRYVCANLCRRRGFHCKEYVHEDVFVYGSCERLYRWSVVANCEDATASSPLIGLFIPL